MKKLLLFFCLCLLGVYSQAQNGLEKIIVEKYYISDATDAANSAAPLPVGSVTYRIYVDMLPGYKFQAAYGSPTHTLFMTTTTSFFNHPDYGAVNPSFSATNAKKNTVMLDSWLSVGGACNGYLGILKSEDDGVGNFVNSNNPKLLQNNDTAAGIPLTTQDGMIAGIVPAFTSIGFTNETDVFNDGSANGNTFTTNNGAWSCLSGSQGPTSSNRVLIAQITTDGEFHFELNIQIGTPSGGSEKYVAQNPTGSEIKLESLTYPIIPVTSVSVNPSSSNIAVAATQQLIATISPANATNQNVSWNSSNTSIATVSSLGLVTGISAGTANIIATTANGNKKDTSIITVIIPVTSITVSPDSANIFVNATQQLTPSILPLDASNKNVTWSSSNSLIANVNSSGLVTGLNEGKATITGTTEDGIKTDSCIITVSAIPVSGVSLSPDSATIAVNTTQQLTDTVFPSNASNKSVTWSSSNTLIATVNSAGLVTGVTPGTAYIIVSTIDGNKKDTSKINVITIPASGISVSPDSVTIAIGATHQIIDIVTPSNATNKTVTWSSSNETVATISSTGLVTGIAAGTTFVTATTIDGNKKDSCKIKITSIPVTGIYLFPDSATIAINETKQLTDTVTPSNATNKSVTWSSSNTSIATVSSSGLVTAGLISGTVIITATTVDGNKKDSCKIKVIIPVTGVSVSPSAASIVVDETKQLTAIFVPSDATNKNVTWSSGNNSIATVSSTGLVTGVALGSTTITVTTKDGNKTGNCTITVTPKTAIETIKNQEVELYPNPVSDILYFKNLSESSTIRVFNILGKLLLIVTDQNSINVAGLSNGFYYVEILKGNSSSIYKIIKE